MFVHDLDAAETAFKQATAPLIFMMFDKIKVFPFLTNVNYKEAMDNKLAEAAEAAAKAMGGVQNNDLQEQGEGVIQPRAGTKSTSKSVRRLDIESFKK
jgi:hypothetical protein